MHGRIHEVEIRPHPPRVALAVQTPVWGFPHCAGRYRPAGPPFLSLVCSSWRCMEAFLRQIWDLTLPGWRWLCAPQYEVATPCGTVSTSGNTVFLSPICSSCRCMEALRMRAWDFSRLGWRCLCEYQVGVSIPYGTVSTRGTTFFVPGLLDL